MKSPRTIGSISPYINRTRQGSFYTLYSIRETLDLSYGSALGHGAAKSESENLGGNIIFKTFERKNNFSVENFGRKNR